MTRFVCFFFGKSLTLIAIYHLSFMKWKIFDSFFAEEDCKGDWPKRFLNDIFVKFRSKCWIYDSDWVLKESVGGSLCLRNLLGVLRIFAVRIKCEIRSTWIIVLNFSLSFKYFLFVSLLLVYFRSVSLSNFSFSQFLSRFSVFMTFYTNFLLFPLHRFSHQIHLSHKFKSLSKQWKNSQKISIVQLSIKFKFPINIFTSQKHNRSKTVFSIQIKKIC